MTVQVARDVVKLAGCNMGDLTSSKFIGSIRAFAGSQDLQKLAEKLKVLFLTFKESSDSKIQARLGCPLWS